MCMHLPLLFHIVLEVMPGPLGKTDKIIFKKSRLERSKIKPICRLHVHT
jgi:hypothetical protein